MYVGFFGRLKSFELQAKRLNKDKMSNKLEHAWLHKKQDLPSSEIRKVCKLFGFTTSLRFLFVSMHDFNEMKNVMDNKFQWFKC